MSDVPRDPKVIELFARAIWEVDQKKFDDLTMEKPIAALGIDSVAMLEVIGFIEEELQIHLPEDRLQQVQTVGDLADAIADVRAAR
jgi:acyl carrier protein